MPSTFATKDTVATIPPGSLPETPITTDDDTDDAAVDTVDNTGMNITEKDAKQMSASDTVEKTDKTPVKTAKKSEKSTEEDKKTKNVEEKDTKTDAKDTAKPDKKTKKTKTEDGTKTKDGKETSSKTDTKDTVKTEETTLEKPAKKTLTDGNQRAKRLSRKLRRQSRPARRLPQE